MNKRKSAKKGDSTVGDTKPRLTTKATFNAQSLHAGSSTSNALHQSKAQSQHQQKDKQQAQPQHQMQQQLQFALPQAYPFNENSIRFLQFARPLSSNAPATVIESCDMHFELVLFFHLVAHLLMQNFNIFRLNFFNYDFYALFLSLVALCKRVLLKYGQHMRYKEQQTREAEQIAAVFNTLTTMQANNSSPITTADLDASLNFHNAHSSSANSNKSSNGSKLNIFRRKNNIPSKKRFVAVSIVFILLFLASVYFMVLLAFRHPLHKMILVAFPFIAYATLFHGGRVIAFYRSLSRANPQKGATSLSQQQQKGASSSSTNTPGVPNSGTLMSNSAVLHQIVIKQLKHLIYSTFECGYYAGFLALGFVSGDKHVYYSLWRCSILIVYVLLNSFVLLFAQLLYTSFLDFLIHTQTVGCWHPLRSTSHKKPALSRLSGDKSTPVWSPHATPYEKGAIVLYKDKYYVAVGEQNNGVPDSSLDYALYFMFENSDVTHTLLIFFQLAVVISQIVLYLYSPVNWVIPAIMLMFNYYLLYLCIWVRRENMSLFPTSVLKSSSPGADDTATTITASINHNKLSAMQTAITAAAAAATKPTTTTASPAPASTLAPAQKTGKNYQVPIMKTPIANIIGSSTAAAAAAAAATIPPIVRPRQFINPMDYIEN
eukprot:GEZU01018850.1.p1 GENE.GEZU01018850.1~~GEZU01018850.1.p1  ORF type:complete len:658 (-),score=108.03 GEZU01018850.1:99-2072(-)